MLIYSFYGPNSLTKNFPTLISQIMSYLVAAIWIIWLNHGFSTLGVTNLTKFSVIGMYKNIFTKDLLHTFVRYSTSLMGAITHMAYPICVMLCVKAVEQFYSDSNTKMVE